MSRRNQLLLKTMVIVYAILASGIELCRAAVPMPDPGGPPDYYTTPNWAFSPPLRKFVDTLPGLNVGAKNNLGQYLPVAIPDTTTYPGSDYYEIELGEYAEKMHSDLPPTRLRGYRQTNTTDADVKKFHYLGPVIVATKNRPVRVKFTNALGAGAAGELFVPVDQTIMGSGPYDIDYDPVTKQPLLTHKTGNFAQNRATLHLHGGRTPWISDGTPHQWVTPATEDQSYGKGVSVAYVPDMWFTATGQTITACAKQTTCNTNGASNNPGPGSQTFYWTNQQSSRFMFYHDHAWGITRLNVYVGEAAGYLITDQTETDLQPFLPADQIPLVIQDKTYVDENTIVNTDPTWNWGTNPGWAVTGDLWWPHVYMPAQNPYNPDMSGINAFGRWHYGPWFWPPTPLCGSAANAIYPFCIAQGPVPNPLYDPACDPATEPSGFCQPPENPGTPNPSWGAEAFLDTPIVNGTPYPVLKVAPKAYRFRVLNASHDRFIDMQLYEADASVPAGCPTCANNSEVKMVPANPRPDCSTIKTSDCTCTATDSPAGCFPITWPTDGREGGVPDPATSGPNIIQIGTEGGFLPQPVVLANNPITWNLDPTMFNVGNVDGGTLILGPAERADIIIDFSQYAGKTLILYNDAPTAFPALDPHYDYYTNNPDRTDIGSSPSTPVGFGPNVRTVMQIQVAATAPAAPYNLNALKAEFASTTNKPGVFEKGQEPILVGQTAYDSTYINTTNNTPFPATWPEWGQSRISDNTLSFWRPNSGSNSGTTPFANIPMLPKAIHDEMGGTFDDFGRMSAKLGLEVPSANAAIANFALQNYADPVTEIAQDGEVQFWKVTHNGVDTHPIHFHLFDVQIINRVGWDGFIRQPDVNELGWKDTVRFSPLEDTIIALRATLPTVPWRLPDSVRPLNPAAPLGDTAGFTNLDALGQPLAIPMTNEITNFGSEYVWHCHILSHEENDMMRPIVAVNLKAPTNLQVGNGFALSWNDNSHNETGFMVQRATDALFTQNVTDFAEPASAPASSFGTTLNMTDASAVAGNQYYYRVQALNDYGSAPRPKIVGSSWSNTAFAASGKEMTLSSSALVFVNQGVNTVSPAKTITVTNTGTTGITITGVTLGGIAPSQFSLTTTCNGQLNSNSTCTVSVSFKPTATGTKNATVTVNETDPGISRSATLSGTGTTTTMTVSPSKRAFGNQMVNLPSLPQLVTIRNAGATTFNINSITLSGANANNFSQTNNCPASLTQSKACTVTLTFTPTALAARSASLNIATSAGTSAVALTGTGTPAEPISAIAPIKLTYPGQVITTTSTAQQVTLSNVGLANMQINAISLAGTDAAAFGFDAATSTCNVANVFTLTAGATCTVGLKFSPTTTGVKTASLSFDTQAPALPKVVALSGTGISPSASALPAALAFGDQLNGAQSSPQTVTVSNSGTAALTISSISVVGGNTTDFTIGANTCGPTLAVNASCTVGVTFTPSATGLRSATLNFAVAAPGQNQAVALGGNGIAPSSGVLPTTLAFGNQVQGIASTAQTVTVSNGGTAPMTISGVALAGVDSTSFAIASNTCGPTLAVNASCTVGVTFTPTATGLKAATLDFTIAAPGQNQSVTLSGTGIAPVATVAPAALSFSNQIINTVSAQQMVQVSNTGDGPLVITAINITGANASGFLFSHNCPSPLAAGLSCAVSVAFAPITGVANQSANLQVVASAPATSKVVPLTGTVSQSVAAVSPLALTFADQNQGTTSASQTLTLTNQGIANLTINSIATVTGTNFALTNNCVSPLASGASCTVTVTFTPTTANATITDSILFSVAAPATSQTIGLTGTSTLPVATVSPATLAFGNQLINTVSAEKIETLSNTGSGPMTITGITLAGADAGQFLKTTTCGPTLAANASCTVSLRFAPTTAVATQGVTLEVAVAPPAQSKSIAVSGGGTIPIAGLSPATILPFADQVINTTSANQAVTITNTGTAPLTMTNIALAGSNPSHFALSQVNNCTASPIAVNGSCTVNVTFTPTTTGVKNAVLNVYSTAPATNQSLILTGTGTAAATNTVSPTKLSFSAQTVKTTSAPQTVSIQNTGSAAMTINTIALSGKSASQFAQTTTCKATLAAGKTCTVSVTFRPTAIGKLGAALDISVAAPAQSQQVSLVGIGQ